MSVPSFSEIAALHEANRVALHPNPDLAQLQAETEQAVLAEREAAKPQPESVMAVAESPRRLPRIPRPQPQSMQVAQYVLTRGIMKAKEELPDWDRYGSRVLQKAGENPEKFAAVLSTGDPDRVAANLASSMSTLQTSDYLTDMKRQAQTLSGTGGRPTNLEGDTATWQNIVNAGNGGYADRRSS